MIDMMAAVAHRTIGFNLLCLCASTSHLRELHGAGVNAQMRAISNSNSMVWTCWSIYIR